MSGHITWYAISLLVSTGISLGLLILVQRWRDTPGIGTFSWQITFQAVWSAFFALEAVFDNVSLKLAAHKIGWVGIVWAVLFWILFVFRYTRQDQWLNRWVLALTAFLPSLFTLAILTNDLHHLFWSGTLVLQSAQGTEILYTRGLLFWGALGFLYAGLIVTFLTLVLTGLIYPEVLRRQVLVLAGSAVAPTVCNVLFFLRLTAFDLTPLGFSFTALALTWAIYRYRLVSLMPVARERMVETLPAGLLALDMRGRVIDANPFLLELAGLQAAPYEEPLERLLQNRPDLLGALQKMAEAPVQTVFERSLERYYEVSRFPLNVRAHEMKGHLVVIRDITQAESSARALRASEENFRDLFEVNPFPMAIVGIDHTRIHEVNQALLDYLNQTREQVIGQRASSFYGGTDIRGELIAEMQQDGLIHDRTLQLRLQDGEERYILLNAYPVEYSGEARLLISFVDITERKREEASEHEQRVLAEVLRDMSALLTSTLDLDEVLDRILENLSRVVRHDVANILMVNEDNIASIARTRGYAEHGRDNPYGKLWLSVENTPTLHKMVRERTQIILPDVSKEPTWLRVEGQEWVRAHLSAPVFTQSGIAGFINLDSNIPGFFNETDAAHLQIFADQAGIAIQNARLYSQIQSAAREAEIFQQISRALSSSLNFERLISELLELIGRLVPSDSAGVSLIEGDTVILRAMRGMEESEDLIGLRFPLAGTANAHVLEKHSSVNFPDIQAVYSGYRLPPHNKIRSVLMLPLVAGGEVIGFLSLDSWVLNHFTIEDERLANAFAADVALALRNARLYEETQRRLKVQSILNEVTRAVTSRLELDTLLELVWQQVNRFLDASYFMITGVDEQGEWHNYYVREAKELAAPALLEDMNGIVGYAIETGRPVYLRSRGEVDVYQRITGHSVPFERMRSAMIVPMRVSEQTLGVMSILNVDRDYAYSAEDYELFTSITSQVAISMENARLFGETRHRAEELSILNRVGTAVASGLDLDPILKALYQECRQVIPSDIFYIAFYDAATGEIEFPLFYDEGVYREIEKLNIKGNSGMTGWILREGKTLYLPDTRSEAIEAKYHIIRLGGVPSRSYLGVPMLLHEKIVGVISMQSIQPNIYTPDHVQLLETIATQAAIAIENARLYKESQRLYQEAQLAATTDFLTGLLNRRELFNRADLEFERARRYRHEMAVMMIDIDHFKVVNDTYGHLAGDQVLRLLARICQENMRLSDVVGRYGGEEILILMPETDQEHAYAAAERLRQQIEALQVETDNGDVAITVSIGIADMTRDRGLTLEMLIKRADVALFRAKDNGRNCVCVYGGI